MGAAPIIVIIIRIIIFKKCLGFSICACTMLARCTITAAACEVFFARDAWYAPCHAAARVHRVDWHDGPRMTSTAFALLGRSFVRRLRSVTLQPVFTAF